MTDHFTNASWQFQRAKQYGVRTVPLIRSDHNLATLIAMAKVFAVGAFGAFALGAIGYFAMVLL